MRLHMTPSPRRAMRPGLTTEDVAARALAAACALNLNGLVGMLFDVGQAVSLLILAGSVYLVLSCGRAAFSAHFVLLVLAIATYLILASVYFDPYATLHEPTKFYLAYAGSILIIWAIAGYVAKVAAAGRERSFLAFLRNVLLVSAASVPASPLLYQVYVNVPPSAVNRLSGFFGNPNEAAIASLFGLVLALAVPLRSWVLHTAALALTSAAVILTLSKTGMSCLVVIWSWYLVRRLKGALVFIAPILGALLIWVIQDFDGLLLALVNDPTLNLDASQRGRILAVADILSGRIDNETSTGRTYLWGLVLERAWDHFPHGSGLGSAHNIIGGVMGYADWLGVHNAFLMFLGEAGPMPLVLLVASLIALARPILVSSRVTFAAQVFFVLLVDMMATHGALATRYHNVMLALLFGLAIHLYGRRVKSKKQAISRLNAKGPAPAYIGHQSLDSAFVGRQSDHPNRNAMQPDVALSISPNGARVHFRSQFDRLAMRYRSVRFVPGSRPPANSLWTDVRLPQGRAPHHR